MKKFTCYPLLLLLLGGCYASTINITDQSLYSIKVTNMLEGYAAPELYLDFSKEAIFIDKETIRKILEQEILSGNSNIPNSLIDDLQTAFNKIAKHFYIRLDTRFSDYDSYCIGIVYQNGSKTIMVQNFSKSGVLNQGTFYPFEDKDWAIKTINKQIQCTNLYDLLGEKISTPVYKEI
jgi:hypothetical protein